MTDNKPRLKRHISIIPHEADRVELRAGGWNVISMELNDEKKTGKLFELLKSLDGSINIAEISKATDVPRSEIESLIDHLIQIDVIEFGPSSSIDYYLDSIAFPLKRGNSSLEEITDLVVVGDENLGPALCKLISEANLGNSVEYMPPDHPDFYEIYSYETAWQYDGLQRQHCVDHFAHLAGKLIVHIDRSLQPTRLSSLNILALNVGFNWIQGCIDGPQLLVGPYFSSQHPPCYECLETRILMNSRETENYILFKKALAKGQAVHASNPSTALLDHMLVSHVATETLNALLTNTTFTRGKMMTVYLPTMEFAFHDVLGVPSCSACSPPPQSATEEMYFDSRILVKA